MLSEFVSVDIDISPITSGFERVLAFLLAFPYFLYL
jgi:hypothetical protein